MGFKRGNRSIKGKDYFFDSKSDSDCFVDGNNHRIMSIDYIEKIKIMTW